MRSDEATAEVTAQDAYDAAEERALKTTRALILAEAQILHWKRKFVAEYNRAESLETEVIDLGGRTKCTKGVEDGEDQDQEAGDAERVGEAGRSG